MTTVSRRVRQAASSTRPCSALAIKSLLRFVSCEEAQAAPGENVHAPPASGGDQVALARGSWQAPPTPLDGGYFGLFLTGRWQSNDNRLHVADENASPLTFVALFPYVDKRHGEASSAFQLAALGRARRDALGRTRRWRGRRMQV
ncbi:hypothetical protein [Micromonospora sp. KC213]|uniref:hypothetical protein n=1 Tax=Micromonospora sp. KC213 TaxID=2530378 RepID=UPI0010451584|nr:hypothetical protein [Micromonospora sp. KC213]TDC33580.1 hypothetical protein E1166_25525 [Micromonospora sp. KC213]